MTYKKQCDQCGYFALIEKNKHRIGYCVKNDELRDNFDEMCKQMKEIEIFDWLIVKRIKAIDTTDLTENEYISKCIDEIAQLELENELMY